MTFIKQYIGFIMLSAGTANCLADTLTTNDKFRYPFYAGITGGYGSTTWEGLVPLKKNKNAAMTVSTPYYVDEGGAVGGVFVGYEFIPYFAIEASYMRYPGAKVTFDEQSLFSYDHDGRTSLNTHAEVYTLQAKIMLIIPHTDIRAYSSFGAGDVHRYDEIANQWRIGPSFGAGINYNFTPHIMGELGANYTSGYGESELNPAQDYLPFLYSIFLRLAYRF